MKEKAQGVFDSGKSTAENAKGNKGNSSKTNAGIVYGSEEKLVPVCGKFCMLHV